MTHDQVDRDQLARDLLAEAGAELARPVPPWEPRSILHGIDLDAPPPSPDLLGLVYVGKFHLLSGAPEAAKTWLAGTIAVEAIREGWSVAWIDTDGTGQADLALRLLGLGLTREQAAQVRYSDDPREWFGSDEHTAETAGWVGRQPGPVLVVIDSANTTITALGATLDESGFTQVEAWVVAPLKRLGASILMLDHTPIHADPSSPYTLGTQRKHAASDVHIRMRATGVALQRGGKPATFTLFGMKDRPGGLERHGTSRHVGRVTFTPNPDGSVSADVELGPPTANEERDAEREAFRPTVLMERVSRWAADQPGAWSKRNATAKGAVKGKAEHLRAAIDVLHREGYLEADGDRYRHRMDYRQATDPKTENGWDAPPGASQGASRPSEAPEWAEGASPRPAHNHAGSQGASHHQGRMRPDSGVGGASPASPPYRGDVGRAHGSRPTDDQLERWQQLATDGDQ